FGDKEFLFHAWLRPFASATDATAGGFTALAMLDGLVAATLAYQSMRSIGPWGVAIPFLVFGGSVDFTARLVRLRPEILSLVLIMVAIELAARRRAFLPGLAACVYTLTYTPFHVFLGLCVAFFALGWWTDGRREWRLVVFGVLYVVRARFVTYFVPLATLSVLRTMAAAGEAPGPTVRIASRSVPFAVAFAVCLLWGVYALPMIFKRMEAAAVNAFRP